MTVHDSQIKLTIMARLTDISILGVAIRTLAAEYGLEMMACTEVELAAVEAITNIVKYGYANQPQGVIDVTLYSNAELLVLILHDQGTPMPEDALENADGSVFNYDVDDIDSWPTSGMGLSLIKAVMDDVQYMSGEAGNILRLVKKK